MTFLCGVLSTSNAKNEAINPDILCYALRFLIDIFLSLPPVCFSDSFFLLRPFLPSPLLSPPTLPPSLPTPSAPFPRCPSLCHASLPPCASPFVPPSLPASPADTCRAFSPLAASFPNSSLPPCLSLPYAQPLAAALARPRSLPGLRARRSQRCRFPRCCCVSHMLSHLLFSSPASPSLAPLCLRASPLLSSSLCLFFSTLSLPSPALFGA